MSQSLVLPLPVRGQETSVLCSSHSPKKVVSLTNLDSMCIKPSQCYTIISLSDEDLKRADPAFSKVETSNFPDKNELINPSMSITYDEALPVLCSSYCPKILTDTPNLCTSQLYLKASDGSENINFNSIQPPSSNPDILNHASLVNSRIHADSYKTVSILRSSHNSNISTAGTDISKQAKHPIHVKKECKNHEMYGKSISSFRPTSETGNLNHPEPITFASSKTISNNQKALTTFKPSSAKMLTIEINAAKHSPSFSYEPLAKNLSRIQPLASMNSILNSAGKKSLIHPLTNLNSDKAIPVSDMSNDIKLLPSQPYPANVNLISICPGSSNSVKLNDTIANTNSSKDVLIDSSYSLQSLTTEYPNKKTDNHPESPNECVSNMQSTAAKIVTLNCLEQSALNNSNCNSYKAAFIPNSSHTTAILTSEKPSYSTNGNFIHLEPTSFGTVLWNTSGYSTFVTPLFDTNTYASYSTNILLSKQNVSAPPTRSEINRHIEPSDESLRVDGHILSKTAILNHPEQTFVPNVIELPICSKASEVNEIKNFVHEYTNSSLTKIKSLNKLEQNYHISQLDDPICSKNPLVFNSTNSLKISKIESNNLNSALLSKISHDGKNINLNSSSIQPASSGVKISSHTETTTFLTPVINATSYEAVSVLRSSQSPNMLPEQNILKRPSLHTVDIKTESSEESLSQLNENIKIVSDCLKVSPLINVKTNSPKTESINSPFNNCVKHSKYIKTEPDDCVISEETIKIPPKSDMVCNLENSESVNTSIFTTFSEPPSYSNNANLINIHPTSSKTTIVNHPSSSKYVHSLFNTHSHKDMPVDSSYCSKLTAEHDMIGLVKHIKTEYENCVKPDENLAESKKDPPKTDIVSNLELSNSVNTRNFTTFPEKDVSKSAAIQEIRISNNSMGLIETACSISTTTVNDNHEMIDEANDISAQRDTQNISLNVLRNSQLPPLLDPLKSQTDPENFIYLLPLEIASLIDDNNLTSVNHTLSNAEINDLILSVSSLASSNTAQSNIIQPNNKTKSMDLKTDGLNESNIKKPTLKDLIEPLEIFFRGNKCLLCGFESKAKWNHRARQHLVTHLKNRDFKCDICDKTFITPANLSVHRTTHSLEYRFSCEECGERFQHRQKLALHVRKHRLCKKYSCPICNVEYKTAHSLKQHLRDHTGEEPYMCSVCNATFKTRQMLRNHSFQHNPEKLYKCDVCDKGYNNKSLLTDHMRIHKKSPGYKCKICEKKFNFKSNLAQHMLVHNGNRRHTCKVCNMKFKFPHHLRAHSVACCGVK